MPGLVEYLNCMKLICRCQWPRGLRLGFCSRSLAGSTGSNPIGASMSVSCECCVLSGRSLYEGLITRPEESYRMWCVRV